MFDKAINESRYSRKDQVKTVLWKTAFKNFDVVWSRDKWYEIS